MRPIKFRGIDIKTGEVVFGFYYEDCEGKPRIIVTLPNGEGQYLPYVDPDSVKQLRGYDADGNEVYEGDKLIDIFGEEYTAAIYDLPQVTQTSKLKEVQA